MSTKPSPASARSKPLAVRELVDPFEDDSDDNDDNEPDEDVAGDDEPELAPELLSSSVNSDVT